jgi:hypothetical protein
MFSFERQLVPDALPCAAAVPPTPVIGQGPEELVELDAVKGARAAVVLALSPSSVRLILKYKNMWSGSPCRRNGGPSTARPGPLAEGRTNDFSTSAFWGTAPLPDQRVAKIAHAVGRRRFKPMSCKHRQRSLAESALRRPAWLYQSGLRRPAWLYQWLYSQLCDSVDWNDEKGRSLVGTNTERPGLTGSHGPALRSAACARGQGVRRWRPPR